MHGSEVEIDTNRNEKLTEAYHIQNTKDGEGDNGWFVLECSFDPR